MGKIIIFIIIIIIIIIIVIIIIQKLPLLPHCVIIKQSGRLLGGSCLLAN